MSSLSAALPALVLLVNLRVNHRSDADEDDMNRCGLAGFGISGWFLDELD